MYKFNLKTILKKSRFSQVAVLILIIFSVSETNAQGSLPKQKFDSLLKSWNSTKNNDTTRLNSIMRVIKEAYMFNFPDSAFYYAEMQYDFAQRKKLKKYIADALKSMGNSLYVKGDYPKSLFYYQKSIKIFEEIKFKRGIGDILFNMSNIYTVKGEKTRALENLKKSLKIFEEIDYKIGIGNVLGNLGNIYSETNQILKSIEYYKKSLSIFTEINNKKGISLMLFNIGNDYYLLNNLTNALEYINKSKNAFEESGDKFYLAMCFEGLGNIYSDKNDFVTSLDYFQKAIKTYEKINNKEGTSLSIISIGQLKIKQKDYKQAIEYCTNGLKISEELELIDRSKNACNCLYDAYKALGDGNNALKYHEKMGELDKKLQAEEMTKQLERMEFQKAMIKDSIAQVDKARRIDEAHKEEVRKKNRTRNILIGGGFILLILSGSFYSRWRYVRKSKAALQVEKDRSENLLLNILPEEIAAELKEKGKADARDFEMVSILFTDFKGFTEQSAKMTPAALVNEINHCFEAFDKIMEKYGIEKIKTIGDAYMAAGGLPVPTDNSVKNTVFAAIEMQDFIKNRKTEKDVLGEPAFEMRVGIHTGPVVAGIVGVKKFQYDIWGDTVNTASRMESNGEAGKVNISQSTFELLKNEPLLSFEERGKVSAKGKGDIDMWFVYKKKA